MSDGKKWAAEQEELEAEERAMAAREHRINLFIGRVVNTNSKKYAKEMLDNCDAIKERFKQLNLEAVPMTRNQHRLAAELTSFIAALP